jgi:hypothetical protein
MKLQDYIIIIELHDITISYFYFVISDFLQKVVGGMNFLTFLSFYVLY